MPTKIKLKRRSKSQTRSPFFLLLLILLWSLAMGWGLAAITSAQPIPTEEIGTVDVVPDRYQLGQELYLENCASCHIAIPPAVLPSPTWQRVLQDSQHYGVNIKPLVDPGRLIVWQYLQVFSRPQLKDEEEIPYRISESRYFKALHPQVKLPRPLELSSCAGCHVKANEYNFRTLSPEWQ